MVAWDMPTAVCFFVHRVWSKQGGLAEQLAASPIYMPQRAAAWGVGAATVLCHEVVSNRESNMVYISHDELLFPFFPSVIGHTSDSSSSERNPSSIIIYIYACICKRRMEFSQLCLFADRCHFVLHRAPHCYTQPYIDPTTSVCLCSFIGGVGCNLRIFLCACVRLCRWIDERMYVDGKWNWEDWLSTPVEIGSSAVNTQKTRGRQQVFPTPTKGGSKHAGDTAPACYQLFPHLSKLGRRNSKNCRHDSFLPPSFTLLLYASEPQLRQIHLQGACLPPSFTLSIYGLEARLPQIHLQGACQHRWRHGGR